MPIGTGSDVKTKPCERWLCCYKTKAYEVVTRSPFGSPGDRVGGGYYWRGMRPGAMAWQNTVAATSSSRKGAHTPSSRCTLESFGAFRSILARARTRSHCGGDGHYRGFATHLDAILVHSNPTKRALDGAVGAELGGQGRS